MPEPLTLKILAAPFAATLVYLYDLLGTATIGRDVQTLLDVAALTTVVAGVFVVGRLRAALALERSSREAAVASADAWKAERDAERSALQRAEGRIVELGAEVAALRARPNVDSLHKTLGELDRSYRELIPAVTKALDASTAATGELADRISAERVEVIAILRDIRSSLATNGGAA